MNDQMRRYLDEDLLDELEREETTATRERRTMDRPPPDPRRQQRKAIGRTFAKAYRTQQKQKRNG